MGSPAPSRHSSRPFERGARHLFHNELRLREGERLFVIRHRAPRTLAAQRVLEHTALLLNIDVSSMLLDHVTMESDAGRHELLTKLREAQACVVVGGGAAQDALLLQTALLEHAKALPSVFLRFDAEALLASPTTPYGAMIGAHARGPHQQLNAWLLEKLQHTRHVVIHHTLTSNVELELGPPFAAAEYSQLGMRAWGYPVGPVSAAVTTIEGTLHAPDVFMPNGDLVTDHEPRVFQFRRGALRAVQGEHGTEWLREAMADVPGMRVSRLSFGTDLSELGHEALSRPVAVSRPGCTLTMLDPHLAHVSPADVPYLGISFCLHSPTLHVQLDGLPVLRDGEYTEAVLRLAGVHSA